MRRRSPRRLWATFRQFTGTETEKIKCTPDMQWNHWASQGDTVESVWNDHEVEGAEEFVSSLRNLTPDHTVLPPITHEEILAGLKHLKEGRSPGKDGIPSDMLRQLPCIVLFANLLFNCVARSVVYPTEWGYALIRSLLKPGKPAESPASLRGIRLLSSMAAWFGKVLDMRARRAWQACPEQFGFRHGTGCLEAVLVLIALIRSRTCADQRLYLLFIDLRTAFPSLNRPILIRRIFQCGLSLAFCRMVLSVLDATLSLVCIGGLVGQGFREKLGVREGSVEGPHHFSMYINGIKERLETQHPRLCEMLGVTIALLLFADDAAIPADSAADLQLAADIFQSFCNDNHLFISTPKTFLTVFHSEGDDGVAYTNDG